MYLYQFGCSGWRWNKSFVANEPSGRLVSTCKDGEMLSSKNVEEEECKEETHQRRVSGLDNDLERIISAGLEVDILCTQTEGSDPVPCLVHPVVAIRVKQGARLRCTVDTQKADSSYNQAISEIILHLEP